MNEQLVGRGQGVCALPIVERGAYGAGCSATEGGRRRAIAAHAACRGGLDCNLWGQGTGRSAPRTSGPCS
eukprot:scaffold65076_cov53-Phaeocystis_antarctica.AAC.1